MDDKKLAFVKITILVLTFFGILFLFSCDEETSCTWTEQFNINGKVYAEGTATGIKNLFIEVTQVSSEDTIRTNSIVDGNFYLQGISKIDETYYIHIEDRDGLGDGGYFQDKDTFIVVDIVDPCVTQTFMEIPMKHREK